MFFLFTICIIVHECGHILAGTYYDFNIDKIIILPFGGLTVFNDKLNRSIKEELIVAVSGPVFQLIFYIILYFLNYNLSDYTTINNIILFINLLPIIPLDGSKIVRSITDFIFSYKMSLDINIFISLIVLMALSIYSIYKFNLICVLMSIFLFKENIKTIKYRKFYFNKFILERYMYDLKFEKIKYIKNITQMKKDYYHMIYDGKKYIKEYNFIALRFDLFNYL